MSDIAEKKAILKEIASNLFKESGLSCITYGEHLNCDAFDCAFKRAPMEGTLGIARVSGMEMLQNSKSGLSELWEHRCKAAIRVASAEHAHA